jgi:gamma-glutamylcyclotransferase (GGCT)/AIG2-like uncharacterized protein YtfP
MLHFAYGSNMSRTLMHRRCPTAVPLVAARLEGWRFIVTHDGYASVVPAPGAVVHGVLWRLAARDCAALNAYESLDSGLYRRRMLPVSHGGRQVSALVYVGRERRAGRPKPGYQELVIQAARDWAMPDDYVRALCRWSPARTGGARRADTGDTA